MKKFILMFLLLSGIVFSQDLIFEDSFGNMVDTVSVDSGTAVTSALIKFNGHPEGVATLYCAGDSVSTTFLGGCIGEYQVYYGLTDARDSLWGVWNAFDDSVLVKGDLAQSYDSGTITGRETDLGNVWTLGSGVRFRFTPHFSGVILARIVFY